jgi:putative transposase
MPGRQRPDNLVARPKRRRRNLTMPDKSARRAPDLVNRDFSPPPEPNTVWVGDLTEIPCEQGRFYLAAVLDLHSRRAVGFAMGAHHDAALATAALQVAIAVRGGDVGGVIFHSDQGGGVHRHPVPQGLRPGEGAPVDGPYRIGSR